MLPEGRYQAKVTGYSGVGESSKGTPQVQLEFTTTDGGTITDWFYLSEAAAEYTLAKLKTCGNTKADVFEVTIDDLRSDVMIKVKHENDQDGNPRARVQYIDPVGRVNAGAPLSDAKREQFKQRLLGIGMKVQAAGGNGGGGAAAPAPKAARQPGDDDIPF